jgi:hypothetical protein
MIKAGRGYTVVEVLIFLAISAVMFVIAFAGTHQQQNGESFRQSINDIELKIRESFNNVDNGYFGNDGTKNCTSDPVSFVVTITDVNGGGNSQCVFVGKELDFSAAALSVITLVGSRLAPSTSFEGSINNSTLTETYQITNSVTLNKMILSDGLNYSGSVNTLNLRVRRDANIIDQANVRATRQYTINSTSWSDVDASHVPYYCFTRDNKKAAITVLPDDIYVDYTGEHC